MLEGPGTPSVTASVPLHLEPPANPLGGLCKHGDRRLPVTSHSRAAAELQPQKGGPLGGGALPGDCPQSRS